MEKTREKLAESEIRNMSEEEREVAKERAIDEVLDAMPEDFVIKPFLSANRAEVKHMLLTEYDEKKTMEMFARDAKKEQRELDEKEIAKITAEKNAALEEVKRLKELLAQKS